jgi:hypothetical protein
MGACVCCGYSTRVTRMNEAVARMAYEFERGPRPMMFDLYLDPPNEKEERSDWKSIMVRVPPSLLASFSDAPLQPMSITRCGAQNASSMAQICAATHPTRSGACRSWRWGCPMWKCRQSRPACGPLTTREACHRNRKDHDGQHASMECTFFHEKLRFNVNRFTNAIQCTGCFTGYMLRLRGSLCAITPPTAACLALGRKRAV